MRNGWTIAGAALLGSVLGSLITNAWRGFARDAHAARSQDEATRARKFEVVDSKGNVRGEWGVRENDRDAYFNLHSPNDSFSGIWLGVDDDAACSLSMSQPRQPQKVTLVPDKDGKPTAQILGKDLKVLWEVM